MKLKVKIAGPKIHNVGYRPRLWQMAMDLSLKGFEAYNVIGSKPQVVVALVEGDDERVRMFYDVARSERPVNAAVDEVASEAYDGDIMPLKDYAALNTSHQLNKGIELLLSMDGKMDRMLDKQDETIGEIRGLRVDVVERSDTHLTRIEKDIRQIKSKIGLR